jgi:hypothetical protein
MPNGTLKILIPFNRVLNWDGVSKLNDTLKNDHATFFKLDRKTHRIECSLKVFICRQYNEKGPYDVNVIYNRWK